MQCILIITQKFDTYGKEFMHFLINNEELYIRYSNLELISEIGASSFESIISLSTLILEG